MQLFSRTESRACLAITMVPDGNFARRRQAASDSVLRSRARARQVAARALTLHGNCRTVSKYKRGVSAAGSPAATRRPALIVVNQSNHHHWRNAINIDRASRTRAILIGPAGDASGNYSAREETRREDAIFRSCFLLILAANRDTLKNHPQNSRSVSTRRALLLVRRCIRMILAESSCKNLAGGRENEVFTFPTRDSRSLSTRVKDSGFSSGCGK